MNKVILKGIISKDIELRSTTSGVEVVAFNLAVQRDFKNKEGNYDADFISCVAYKNTATFINKYFTKSSKILLEGKLQTRTYEKDGNKKYITEVIVEKAEFVDNKKTEEIPAEEVEVPQNYKSNYEEKEESIQLSDDDIDKVFDNSLPF